MNTTTILQEARQVITHHLITEFSEYYWTHQPNPTQADYIKRQLETFRILESLPTNRFFYEFKHILKEM